MSRSSRCQWKLDWRQLARGHDHVSEGLEVMGLVPFFAVGLESTKIPEDLDPAELRD
jgi:hypothetical protein